VLLGFYQMLSEFNTHVMRLVQVSHLTAHMFHRRELVLILSPTQGAVERQSGPEVCGITACHRVTNSDTNRPPKPKITNDLSFDRDKAGYG
jgi:hypothetical protein